MKFSYRSIAAVVFLPLLVVGVACEPSEGSGVDAGVDAQPPEATKDAQVTSDAKVDDGGTPDSASNPAGKANAETYCSTRCAFSDRCSKAETACANGGASCVAKATPIAGFWRSEYVDSFKTCFPALACAEKTDTCVTDGFAVADPSFPNSAYTKDCLAKRASCANVFADDLCLSIAALTDENRAKADACKSQDCAKVGDCLRAVGAFTY